MRNSIRDSRDGGAAVAVGRRSFLAAAGAAVVGGYLGPPVGRASPGAIAAGDVSTPVEGRSAIKLSAAVLSDASDEYLLFLRQLGLSHVDVVIARAGYGRQEIIDMAQRLRDEGFELGSVNNYGFWSTDRRDQFVLGLGDRDQVIDVYARYLRDAAAAGFRCDMFSWGGHRVPHPYASDRTTSRGAETVYIDHDPERDRALAYDRRYGEEEMWENFGHWARRIMPVAEDAGISIAVHPTVGLRESGGVARQFNSWRSYERAFEIAQSARFGMTFCVGVWATNPELFGDPSEAIRHFGGQKRIFHGHYRNLDAPLPRSVEVFLDNGYVDMHAVMKAFYHVGFDGTLIPDHSPIFINGRIAHGGPRIGSGTGTAYAIGYMRGVLQGLERGWRPG